MYINQDGAKYSYVDLNHHKWNLPSQKKSHCFTTMFIFSNYPQYPQQIDTICVDRTPGCHVQIDKADFNTFVVANNDTNQEVQANFMLIGSSSSNCGHKIDVNATLTGIDGSSYIVEIIKEWIFVNYNNF